MPKGCPLPASPPRVAEDEERLYGWISEWRDAKASGSSAGPSERSALARRAFDARGAASMRLPRAYCTRAPLHP